MKLVEVFERIGLVEIPKEERLPKDQDAQAPEGGETRDEVAGSEASADIGMESAAGPAVELGAAGIEENRPLEAVYSAAGIAESPFSADKLLKLLDALSNLPEDTRKQAVIAMDAAEDAWTIEDPLLDAQRRIRALEHEKKRLGDQANGVEARAAKELEAQSEYERQAVAQIRQQIADLETLMEREVRGVAESRERIKAEGKAVREACQREQSRLDAEIGRLQQIEKMFKVDPTDMNSQNNHKEGTKNG